MQQYSIFFNHIPYSNQTLNEYKKTHPKRIYRSYTNPYKTDLDLILRSFLAKFYSNDNEKLDIL